VVEAKQRTPLDDRAGEYSYSVSWYSKQHGFGGVGAKIRPDDPFVAECWERAVPGEPAPEACLTREALFQETGSFASRPWVSFGLVLAAIAAVAWVALRQVDRGVAVVAGARVVASAAGTSGNGRGGPAERHLPLFERAEREKRAYLPAQLARIDRAVRGYGRALFLRSLVAGAAFVVALGWVVGFVAAGEWALVASLSLGFAVVLYYLAATFLTDNLRDVTHHRSLIGLGAASGFLVGALAGSLLFDPWVGWDGVRWLF